MNIGKVIRDRRKHLGMKLEQVAGSMKSYDASNLSKFERGMQEVGSDKLSEIAKILRISISEIYHAAETGDLSSIVPPDSIPLIEPQANMSVEVPVLDVVASMGEGVMIPEHETVIDNMRLSYRWLRETIIFSNPDNLSVITGYGDSMTPTYQDGDILLVDRGITEIKTDAVYVFVYRGELFIKRISRRPGGNLLMISDNTRYPPHEFENGDLSEMQVIGRIVWVWNGHKM